MYYKYIFFLFLHSDLESEMYQLSHLITEQKSLLTSLLELSITGKLYKKFIHITFHCTSSMIGMKKN